MTPEILALLVAAGVAGGLMNAIAGGATLITFPAMLASGLPPIVANASNAVAVTPGHLVAALSDRAALPPMRAPLVTAVLGALAGGTAGAVLLLVTPEDVFTMLVPALIAAATLVFAFAGRIQAGVARALGSTATEYPVARGLAVAPTAVYGGYFGGGLGVMLLAVLLMTGREDVRAANAFKNLLSSMVSAATVTIFTVQGAVAWPQTLVMLGGAVAGGFAGGRLMRVLPPAVARTIVVAIGATTSVVYAARYWL